MTRPPCFTFNKRSRQVLTTLPNMCPEHDADDPVKFTITINPVGTGPFTEVSTFEPQGLLIDSHPNYWQADKFRGSVIRRRKAYAANGPDEPRHQRRTDWAASIPPIIECLRRHGPRGYLPLPVA